MWGGFTCTSSSRSPTFLCATPRYTHPFAPPPRPTPPLCQALSSQGCSCKSDITWGVHSLLCRDQEICSLTQSPAAAAIVALMQCNYCSTLFVDHAVHELMQCLNGCNASSHAMPDRQAFLEGLLEAYCTEVGGRQLSDRALMLSAATVELLRGHRLLADHAVSLGYVERLLKLLSARLPSKPLGKLL